MTTATRTPLEGHPHATVTGGRVSSDFSLPTAPTADERVVFVTRGMTVRLHPQDEGPSLAVLVHPESWEEWATYAEQAMALHRRHGVVLRCDPENAAALTIGNRTGRRDVTFFAPTGYRRLDFPRSLVDTAWQLAACVPVEHTSGF